MTVIVGLGGVMPDFGVTASPVNVPVSFATSTLGGLGFAELPDLTDNSGTGLGAVDAGA